MKHLLLALSISIPSLSFACIDLSGTYTMCQSDLGSENISEVTINQSTPTMKITTVQDSESSSVDYILDGISRTSDYEIDGEKGELSTTASCDSTQVKVDFVVDVSQIVIESGYTIAKDPAGRLLVTEYLDGMELNQTICESVK